MKKSRIINIACLGVIMFLYSCFPEQEVSPVKDPSNNSVATITPQGDYSIVKEGDTLVFDITVSKMVENAVQFSLQVDESSTIADDDIVIEGGNLSSYSTGTQLTVIVVPDALPEEGETFVFSISSEEDITWNFQLSPNSDVLMGNTKINNYDFSLDWSEGTFEDMDMCDWNVDFDIYVANADFSEGVFGGATGACPLESASLSGLPDGTYDIYVDYYDGGIEGELPNVEIPYTASFSHNSGALFTIEGTYNGVDDVGASTVIGQIVISGGTYTLLDDQGNEIGAM